MHSEDFPALPGSGPGSGPPGSGRDMSNVIGRTPSSSMGTFKPQSSQSPSPNDHSDFPMLGYPRQEKLNGETLKPFVLPLSLN